MPEVEIRQAHSEDREAVLAFCSHTWEWGDYIERVWDNWLHDPMGQLLVALIDNQPVGVVHVRMLSETDAWQEGMRIDPAYRNQGLARQLSTEASAEAIRRGARSVRLVIESTNQASIHLAESMYFRRVGIFAPYTASPVTSIPRSNVSQDALALAMPGDLDEIVRYLNVSSIFPAVGGLYYVGFTGYRISDRFLNEKIQSREIYLLRRWERLDGLVIAERRATGQKPHLFIGYIDGTTESISLIAYTLRHDLSEMGLNEVRASAPDLVMVRDALAGAEYEWAGSLYYTYERDLI